MKRNGSEKVKKKKKTTGRHDGKRLKEKETDSKKKHKRQNSLSKTTGFLGSFCRCTMSMKVSYLLYT